MRLQLLLLLALCIFLSRSSGAAPVFVHYYIWWDASHWNHLLGSQYPYAARPLPLPSTPTADGMSLVWFLFSFVASHPTATRLQLYVPLRLWLQTERYSSG